MDRLRDADPAVTLGFLWDRHEYLIYPRRVTASAQGMRYLFVFLLAWSGLRAEVTAEFEAALQHHLDAIAHRDLGAFRASLTRGPVLYTIFQNGGAVTTPAETLALHEEWFQDPNWSWEGEIIHQVVGSDLGFVLMKYQYRSTPEDTPSTTWLTLVFQRLPDGSWHLVHDQNTLITPELAGSAD